MQKPALRASPVSSRPAPGRTAASSQRRTSSASGGAPLTGRSDAYNDKLGRLRDILNSHRGPTPQSPKAQLAGSLADMQPSIASLESPASGVSLIEEYSMRTGAPDPVTSTVAAHPKSSISPVKSAPAKSAFQAESIMGAAAASPSAESVSEALGLEHRALSARSVSFRESPSRGQLMHSPSRKDSGGLPSHRSILKRDSMKNVPRSGFEEPEPHEQVCDSSSAVPTCVCGA